MKINLQSSHLFRKLVTFNKEILSDDPIKAQILLQHYECWSGRTAG